MTPLYIFDLDGTLVDSQHAIVAAMEQAFRDSNLAPPPRPAILNVVGLSLDLAVMQLMRVRDPVTAHPVAERYKDAFAELRARCARADDRTTVISQAKGFRGYKVNKGIESPERYILQIFWDTLENHTVDFRGGALFPQWRAIVGPFFAQPPVVEHFVLVDKSD